MKFCKNCGSALSDDFKFCQNCGAKCENEGGGEGIKEVLFIRQSAAAPQSAEYETKGPWKAFAKVGKTIGLISFIWSLIPFFGIWAITLANTGIDFSILGKVYRKNGSCIKTGLGFNIAAIMISLHKLLIWALIMMAYGQ